MVTVVEHSSSDNNNQESSLKFLIPSLCKLSAGTEFSSYKEPQWNFLLGGGNDITAYTISSSDDANDNDNIILGCVLRIRFKKVFNNVEDENEDEEDAGYGMMLVSPKARGKGYAKKLLRVAMSKDEQRRKLLAVCSNLGQPVYRKLGFQNVGRIVAISSTIDAIRRNTTTTTAEEEKNDDNNNNNNFSSSSTFHTKMYSHPNINPSIQTLLFDMDKDATGYDRKERLSYLLNHNDNKERTHVIVVRRGKNDSSKDDDNDNNKILVIGVVRQEYDNGPLKVGPVIASSTTTITEQDDDDNNNTLVKEATFELIQTLANNNKHHHHHFDNNDLKIIMLLNCHDDDDNDDDNATDEKKSLNFVSYFKERGGFTELFDNPAMAKDNNDDENENNKKVLLPIYQKSKNYIALIHPTLG